MTAQELPSIAVIRQLLDYDPSTGILRWKFRDPSFFKKGNRSQQWSANSWNAKFAGEVAFTRIDSDGAGHDYLGGSILRRSFVAQRVIWAIVYGYWPDLDIDHKDGDTLNNRILNLREVTPRENQLNCRKSKNNTSGFNGVYWDAENGKWRALIKINFKSVCLGRYANIDDAISARVAANIRYGFTERHGL